MAGFLLFCERTSIELRSIIRRTAAHPSGASAASALFNACGVSPSPGTNHSENPAYGWVFAFLRAVSPSNSVRLFAAPRLTPPGPARQARCSTPTALVRVRAPLFKEPAHKAVFCFWGASTSFPSKSPPPLCQKKFIARDFACPTLSRINCLSVGPLVLREKPYHQRR
ncbi:Uncharacterised protein [Klebsiella oxytoca]|nr:Uncharacterised protein [Klebsiella oxytoca]SBL85048.1 Uncharacterised protein [Klebsiella oxytoca]